MWRRLRMAERSSICSTPPRPAEIDAFAPRIKRTLDIAKFVPDLQDGMAGAVEYGTARRLRASFTELPVFGKTGTCSNLGTRYGWFASYSDSPQGSLVTVFFLEGGRPTFGPRAAELTGAFYRNLWDHDYFAEKSRAPPPDAGVFDRLRQHSLLRAPTSSFRHFSLRKAAREAAFSMVRKPEDMPRPILLQVRYGQMPPRYQSLRFRTRDAPRRRGGMSNFAAVFCNHLKRFPAKIIG